jgi:hypothetical protein
MPGPPSKESVDHIGLCEGKYYKCSHDKFEATLNRVLDFLRSEEALETVGFAWTECEIEKDIHSQDIAEHVWCFSPKFNGID